MSGINLDFDYILDEPGEIHVEADRYEDGTAYGKATQGSLKSGELGLCVCIAAYDPEEENGYMAHIAGMGNSKEEFRDDVQRFAYLIQQSKEDKVLDDVRFFLGGSCFENPFGDSTSTVSQDDVWKIGGQRITAEKILKGYSEDVIVEWNSEEGYHSEVVVKPETQDIFSYDREKRKRK